MGAALRGGPVDSIGMHWLQHRIASTNQHPISMGTRCVCMLRLCHTARVRGWYIPYFLSRSRYDRGAPYLRQDQLSGDRVRFSGLWTRWKERMRYRGGSRDPSPISVPYQIVRSKYGNPIFRAPRGIAAARSPHLAFPRYQPNPATRQDVIFIVGRRRQCRWIDRTGWRT